MPRKRVTKRYRAFFFDTRKLAYQTGPDSTHFHYAAKNLTGKITWHATYDLARTAAGRRGEVVNALCAPID